MKSERLYSILVWLLAALCAACTADDYAPDANNNGTRTALQLAALQVESAMQAADSRAGHTDDGSTDSRTGSTDSDGSIGTRTGSTDPDDGSIGTRAVTTTPYHTARLIGFFVKAGGHYKKVNNRKGVYDNSRGRGLWLPVADTPADSIWLDNHDEDVCIYAPYDAGNDTLNTKTDGLIKLTAGKDPSSREAWAHRFKVNHQSVFTLGTLTMQRLHARLQVSVKKSDDYPSLLYLNSLLFVNSKDGICQCPAEAIYNVFADVPDGTAEADKPYVGYTYGTKPLEVLLSPYTDYSTFTDGYEIDVLVIPRRLTDDIKLTIDGMFPTTIPPDKTNASKWVRRLFSVTIQKTKFNSQIEAGKSYKVELTFKPTDIEVSSVKVAEWDVNTLKDDYNTDFEPKFEDDTP